MPPAESRLKGDLLTHKLIIYLAGRMGDAIAYEGLSDVADFTREDSEHVERFYFAARELVGVGIFGVELASVSGQATHGLHLCVRDFYDPFIKHFLAIVCGVYLYR